LVTLIDLLLAAEVVPGFSEESIMATALFYICFF
jgi:hypothetical protein